MMFLFDGERIEARPGDTVASALLRTGRRVVATSPYLARPRGVVGIGEEESGAFVQVDSGVGEPMRPATRVEVVVGLVVRGLAGRGDLPDTADEARYDRAQLYCEVLVVGGGAAGVAAANRAAAAGQGRVVLVHDGPMDDGPVGRGALAPLDPAVRVLSRTTVTGLFDAGLAVALERRSDHLPPQATPARARMRVWHIRAGRTVLATGAFERPLAFADNDRPGVMLAGAAATYATRHGVSWRGAVVVGTDDTGLVAAAALHDAGTPVLLVVDVRTGLSGGAIAALTSRGIEVRQGWTAVGTEAATDGGVAAVLLAPPAPDRRSTGPCDVVACDLVAVNGGWSPNVALFSHVGGPLVWDAARVAFVADQRAPRLRTDVTVVGAAAGDSGASNPPATFFGVPPVDPAVAARVFVDPGRDATLADLHRALGAGLRSVEHVKRFTTIGTGPDQGRTSGVLAIGLLAGILGVSPGEIGTTTFRPPYVPLPFAALAGRDRGRRSDPERVTPMHDHHVQAGAVFEVVGQWLRPRYFPRQPPGGPAESMADAVLRECAAVRRGVGMMDAATLGKIDVRGPDAAVFLDRLYTNIMSTVRPGRARYGVMCAADGMVFDDGVVLRLADDHFLVTTTTGGAARVLDWMEEWLQTEWPDLRVRPTSVTDQIATVVVAGPRSREVVAALAPDLDVSAAAMAYLGHAEAVIAGAPGRVVRVSFSGELAFELMVPAWYGGHVWQAAADAGAAVDITAYGTEAMHVLRAEKGYVIVGQETDGAQTPTDLGMSWLVRPPVDKAGTPTPDFVGRRSFTRSDTSRAGRPQLVGLLPVDPQRLLPEGAQLVEVNADLTATPVAMLGHVTSSYRSAELGRTFALALVAGGADRHGDRLRASFGVDDAEVVVTPPVFVDPGGTRRDGGNGRAGEQLTSGRPAAAARPTAWAGSATRRSPLAGAAWGDPLTVWIAEVPFTTAVELRGHAELGVALPAVVGETRRWAGGRRISCLGPRWWLVTGPPGDTGLAPDVAAVVIDGSAVDVSAHRTRLDVAGPRWAHVLRHVWAHDLDRFDVGRCAQGLLGRTQALLVRESGDRVAVHVRASFALYAYDLLTDAAAEYV